MPINAFIETEIRFLKDLRGQLTENVLPTGLEGDWTKMPLKDRMAILRKLPPESRCMFTLRDSCLVDDILAKSILPAMMKSGIESLSAEYVLTAAGFCTEEGGESNFRTLPDHRANVRRDIHLVTSRITQQEKTVDKRADIITDHLLRIAKDEKLVSTSDKRRSTKFARQMFNIRLMQTLALHGIGTPYLDAMGVNKNTSLAVLKRNQGSSIREIDAINDVLHFLPEKTYAKHLAQEAIETRERPYAQVYSIKPAELREEIELNGDQRFVRGNLMVFLRALGLNNVNNISRQDAENKNSEFRRKIALVLDSLYHKNGNGHDINNEMVAIRVYECINIMKPLILSARPPMVK
ncbi:MAG: hypothetical protein O2904_00455 [bacterium]|nr:hypothetical protein [bacterium]